MIVGASMSVDSFSRDRQSASGTVTATARRESEPCDAVNLPSQRPTSTGKVRATTPADRAAFPMTSALCATHPIELEWVPDRERTVVPDAMTSLCRRCNGRPQCLLWALATKEPGYWAGTTTADRAEMRRTGSSSIQGADRLQRDAMREARVGALHADGASSYRWYKRGCRCVECRAASADKRADERERIRVRREAARARGTARPDAGTRGQT